MTPSPTPLFFFVILLFLLSSLLVPPWRLSTTATSTSAVVTIQEYNLVSSRSHVQSSSRGGRHPLIFGHDDLSFKAHHACPTEPDETRPGSQLTNSQGNVPSRGTSSTTVPPSHYRSTIQTIPTGVAPGPGCPAREGGGATGGGGARSSYSY